MLLSLPAHALARRFVLASIVAALTVATATATDRYVSRTGTNSGAGGIGAPWQTVTYALANATSGDTIYLTAGETHDADTDMTWTSATGNGDTITITTTDGNPVTFAPSSATRTFNFTGTGWSSASNLTIKHVDFRSAGSLTQGVVDLNGTGAGLVTIRFEDCSFWNTPKTARAVYDTVSASANRAYEFVRCVFDSSANTANYTMNMQKQHDHLLFDACTFNAGQQSMLVVGQAAAQGDNYITITNCTFNSLSLASGETPIYHNETTTPFTKRIICTGNTFNTSRKGPRFQGGIGSLVFDDNTVNASGSSELAWVIGYDQVPSGQLLTYASVKRNAVNYTGASASHGIFIGAGVGSGEVAYNTCNSATAAQTCDVGLVVKGCSKVWVHHNAIGPIRGGCLYIRGATDCVIANNSFYRPGSPAGSVTYAVLIDSIDTSGNYDPARNHVLANLFYIGDGAPTSSPNNAMIYLSDDIHDGVTTIVSHVFDRNVYRVPSGLNVMRIETVGADPTGTDYATLGDARTFWLANATINVQNQQSDVLADPLFYSLSDLRIGAASPGVGTLRTLWNNAGAWQVTGGGGRTRLGF